jgi:hypothetical protein
MIRPKKLPRDSNQRAHRIAQLLSGEATLPTEPERSQVSAYLAEIGRKGGLKGGNARAAKLSKARRKAIAQKAAKKRWKSRPKTIIATESSGHSH